MTKNAWGVEVIHGGEDFSRWDWGAGYGEAHEAFVREISIEAAKVVLAELAKDAMPGLDTDAVFSLNAFDGAFFLQVSLDTLVADFIESHEDPPVGKIVGGEDRQEAERLIAQLEQAAAVIRATLS